MRLLFMIPYCQTSVYKCVFPDISKRNNQQFHKYFSLLINGLQSNGVVITVGCQFDINSDICPLNVVNIADNYEHGIQYHYFKTYNKKILGRIVKCFQSWKYCQAFCKQNPDAIVICDPNKVSSTFGAFIGTKLGRGKLVHVLSDLPSINTGSLNKDRTFRQRIADWIISKADGYYFFTEAMNELVNKKNKPYVVIECLADENLEKETCSLYEKYPHRVMMYTGGIVAHYGLEQLVKAFQIAAVPNTELWFYGGGTFADGLQKLCCGTTNIKFLGVLPNEQIVQEQQRATVLVNPRLTKYEYTKYSFPSKNMEYMSSGTPTLTTRLPGMPEEYNDYVFLFNGETPEEMASVIRNVYQLSDYELSAFGLRAKKWCIENKGSVFQTERFIAEVINKIQ